eukprot:scaffold6884_cov48-Phaeocystis_antarctica.AAC.2
MSSCSSWLGLGPGLGLGLGVGLELGSGLGSGSGSGLGLGFEPALVDLEHLFNVRLPYVHLGRL